MKRLTGRWRTGLASSFFIAEPSRGTCSILPLWVKSRCVPGGSGWTSGRGVGPTGGRSPPCSTPTDDTIRDEGGTLGSLGSPPLASRTSWFPHTLGCCPVPSGSRGSPARCGPRTSSSPSCRGTGWARRRRSHHTWGCSGRRRGGGLAVRTLSRTAGFPCGSGTGFSSSLVRQRQGELRFLHR